VAGRRLICASVLTGVVLVLAEVLLFLPLSSAAAHEQHDDDGHDDRHARDEQRATEPRAGPGRARGGAPGAGSRGGGGRREELRHGLSRDFFCVCFCFCVRVSPWYFGQPLARQRRQLRHERPCVAAPALGARQIGPGAAVVLELAEQVVGDLLAALGGRAALDGRRSARPQRRALARAPRRAPS